MRLALAASALVVAAVPLVSSPVAQPIETAHVSIATSTSTAAGKWVLHVDVSPKATMHVYAPGEKDVIPIAVKLDANQAIKAGKPVFPAPQKYFFPPLKLTQLVYSSPFRITLPITIASKSIGVLTVTGTVVYQACDDAVCYVPKQVPVKWTLPASPR